VLHGIIYFSPNMAVNTGRIFYSFPPTARLLSRDLYRIQSHSLPGITESVFACSQLPLMPECKATPFPVGVLWGKKLGKYFIYPVNQGQTHTTAQD